jgi:hypothetical protein
MTRRKPRRYSLPEGHFISASALKRADRETKLSVMEDWFFENYEDPVKNTPYDSGGGGYQYISIRAGSSQSVSSLR